MIKGYKGFDKDMKCRGFQYEVGKTYTHTGEVKACESGFHFCENPLDVFKYYPMTGSKFAEVVGDGKVDKGRDDSKVSCSSLKIGAEITISAMIQGAVKFIFEKASVKKEGNAAASGKYGNAAASGERGNAAASGERGNAAASGERGNAAASGERGNAAASGWQGNAAASGWQGNAAASGNYGNAAASGKYGNAAASGNYGNAAASGERGNAAALGKNAIAASIGKEGRAKAALGNWIVLAEWANNYEPKVVKAVKVDGKKIKADTFYTLKDGKFTEA